MASLNTRTLSRKRSIPFFPPSKVGVCRPMSWRYLMKLGTPRYYISSRNLTMQALRFEKTGSFDHLTLSNVENPSLASGEALIRVRAAGINGVNPSSFCNTLTLTRGNPVRCGSRPRCASFCYDTPHVRKRFFRRSRRSIG